MPRNELFLGGLSKETRRKDLEDIFKRYGKLTRCDIKYVNGTLSANDFCYKLNKSTKTITRLRRYRIWFRCI